MNGEVIARERRTDWRVLGLIFVASLALGPTAFGSLGVEGWWRVLTGAVMVAAYAASWWLGRGRRKSTGTDWKGPK